MRLVAVILVMSCAVGACFSSSNSDSSKYYGISFPSEPGPKLGSGGPSAGPSVGGGGLSGASSNSISGPTLGNGGARHSTTVGQGGAGGPALHNDLSSGSSSETGGSSGGGFCVPPQTVTVIGADASASSCTAHSASSEICPQVGDGGLPTCFSPCGDTEYEVECFGTSAPPAPDPSLGCQTAISEATVVYYCCPCAG